MLQTLFEVDVTIQKQPLTTQRGPTKTQPPLTRSRLSVAELTNWKQIVAHDLALMKRAMERDVLPPPDSGSRRRSAGTTKAGFRELLIKGGILSGTGKITRKYK